VNSDTDDAHQARSVLDAAAVGFSIAGFASPLRRVVGSHLVNSGRFATARLWRSPRSSRRWGRVETRTPSNTMAEAIELVYIAELIDRKVWSGITR
jgi:hypothetical protein